MYDIVRLVLFDVSYGVSEHTWRTEACLDLPIREGCLAGQGQIHFVVFSVVVAFTAPSAERCLVICHRETERTIGKSRRTTNTTRKRQPAAQW